MIGHKLPNKTKSATVVEPKKKFATKHAHGGGKSDRACCGYRTIGVRYKIASYKRFERWSTLIVCAEQNRFHTTVEWDLDCAILACLNLLVLRAFPDPDL
jgi:hypothetical protein